MAHRHIHIYIHDAQGHDPKSGQFTSEQHSSAAAHHKERETYHSEESKKRGEDRSRPAHGSHAEAASHHNSAVFYHGKAAENPGEYAKKAHRQTSIANSASKKIEKGENYPTEKSNSNERKMVGEKGHAVKRMDRYLRENRVRR